MIRVNGDDSQIAVGTTVATLLAQLEAPDRGVAVAIDGDVVPRSQWAQTKLEDNANVEVVMAVQGG
jgi:sulfur carrier protein